MKRVIGRVLAQGTKSGVANLVVTAYHAKSGEQEFRKREVSEELIHGAGKRISSVLTDNDGQFVLATDDLKFEGNESRPNLVIIVFAPEDVQDAKRPYPLPPARRVLYMSSVPRVDAGAEEAFVIRISQEQLNALNIPWSGSEKASETQAERVANGIAGTWQVRDSLRERLKPRLQKEHKRNLEFKQLAREKVKDLNGIPAHLRSKGQRNSQFLIMKRQDLASDLPNLQDSVFRQGFQRLKKRETKLNLRLSQDDLKDLNLSIKAGKISGRVSPKDLAKKAAQLRGGVDLVKKRGLRNPSPEELFAKYLAPKPLTKGASPGQPARSNPRLNTTPKKKPPARRSTEALAQPSSRTQSRVRTAK